MKTRLLFALFAVAFLGTMGIANAKREGKGKNKEGWKAKREAFKAEMKELKEKDPEAFKAKRE